MSVDQQTKKSSNSMEGKKQDSLMSHIIGGGLKLDSSGGKDSGKKLSCIGMHSGKGGGQG